MVFTTVVDWLGATVDTGAKKLVLPTAVRNVLVKAFSEGVVFEDDVPMDGTVDATSLGAELKMWKTALAQHAATLKEPVTDLEVVRFELWLTSRLTKPKEVTPNSKDVNDIPVQAEMAADMAAQGMSLPEELAGLELALYLGRPGARGELEGWEYGKPATHTLGAIREKKTGSKVGWMSIDEVIVAGLASGDASDLTLFVQELTTRLSRSELLKSYKTSSNKIQTWYNYARNSVADDEVLLAYLKLYRAQYQGRGLVSEFDSVLYIGADNKLKAQRAKKARPLDLGDLASSVGSHTGGGASTASYPNTSVSGQSHGPPAYVSELMGSIASVASMMQSMQSRLDSLETAAPAGPPPAPPCWECGSTAHKKDQCPTFLAKKRKLEEEKAKK